MDEESEDDIYITQNKFGKKNRADEEFNILDIGVPEIFDVGEPEIFDVGMYIFD